MVMSAAVGDGYECCGGMWVVSGGAVDNRCRERGGGWRLFVVVGGGHMQREGE
ncbi:hypothetical protein Hanom_Chr08g00698281 [Helianthus anomalus]